MIEFCGDSVVQEGLGEECEPPNTDTCDAQCQLRECPDEDMDGVCDEDDMCPNTPKNATIDPMGCDVFQFCRKLSCDPDCLRADWMGDGDEEDPKDCTVGFIQKEGKIQQPVCVARRVFVDMCVEE